MKKMRATFFRQHGDIRRLQHGYLPRPKPGPGEVLVRVRACALNHLDIWTLMGMPGLEIPLPHILGCDIAGEVVETGPRVKKMALNRPVIVAPGVVRTPKSGFSDGKWDSLSDGYQIIGFQLDGGYAEFVKVPAVNIIPVSRKLSYEEWASIPLTFLTAWHMLKTRAEIRKGEWVLIHAAGSGVGSAAIQLARHFGAHVITTVGSDAKIRRAKAIGAHHVIPYHRKDFAHEVRRITQGRGVDVVLEHIGPATFTRSLESLTRRGRLVTCGVTTGPVTQVNLRYIFANQLTIHGSYMGGIRELKEVIQLVEKKKLRPVIDRLFHLREAPRALERMMNRHNFGKIILTP